MGDESKFESKYWFVKDLSYLGVFVLVMVVTMLLIPQFGLFFGKGAEKQFNIEKVELFQGFGIGFLLFIVVFKLIFIIGMLISENAWKYLGWMDIPILDFEKSVLYALGKAFKLGDGLMLLANPFRQFIWGQILMLGLGFVAITTNTFLAEIPQMQVTAFGEGSLFVFPASSSEWLLIMAVGGTIWGTIFWFARKYEWDDGLKWIVTIFSVIISIVSSHTVLHFLRYGASELGLQNVFFFGLVSSVLYLFMGGFMIAWDLHPSNNFAKWLAGDKVAGIAPPFSEEATLILVLFMVIFLLFCGIAFEYFAYRYRKKKRGMVEGKV